MLKKKSNVDYENFKKAIKMPAMNEEILNNLPNKEQLNVCE